MRSLRLIRIGPGSLRLTAFAANLLAGFQFRAKGWKSVMPASLNNFSLAKASLSLLLLLVLPAATLTAFAQDKDQNKEQTWGDSSVPQVYNVENTGAHYPAPNFPSFSQLPIVRPLPDPFRFADGFRDTSFPSWERRRNEIYHAVENYMLGPKPDCHDCTISAVYTPDATNPLTGSLTVTVTRNGNTMTLPANVTFPSSGSGPFPYIIGISGGGSGPYTGSLPASIFTNVATVEFLEGDVTGVSAPSATDAFYKLYPELCAGPTCTVATNFGQGGSNSGQYAAWAWGISRLIDGIEIASKQAANPLPLDTTHSAVTGCSYAGKEALYAGALDERITLTIAQENGGGGAPSFRFNHDVESPAPPGSALGAAGSVEDIDDTNYGWFSGQMFQFAGSNVYKLPIDQHELMAMVAPRALLETGNTDFYWLGNGSNYVSARATQQIYNQFGIGDRFGFVIDGNHNHCSVPAVQVPQIAAFVDRFLLGQNVSTDIEVYPKPYVQEETQPPYSLPMGDYSGNYLASNGTPFPTDYPYLFTTMDYRRWTHWWGSNNPVFPDIWNTPAFPDNWNTGGTFDLWSDNSLNLKSGDTVTAGYDITMPGKHPAATVSVPNANIQMDVLCPNGSSYTLTIPLSAETYSIPANNNSWFPSASQNSPLVYQGSATNPGCSGGGQGRATRAYFTAVGLQDGYAGDGAGPGFILSDTADPTDVRFHATVNSSGRWSEDTGSWSQTVTVNPYPINYPSPPLPQQF